MNLLPIGTASATSSSFIVPPGGSASIYIITTAPAEIDPVTLSAYAVDIERLDSNSRWYKVDCLTDVEKGLVWFGAGEFRVHRVATGASYGVDLEIAP